MEKTLPHSPKELRQKWKRHSPHSHTPQGASPEMEKTLPTLPRPPQGASPEMEKTLPNAAKCSIGVFAR